MNRSVIWLLGLLAGVALAIPGWGEAPKEGLIQLPKPVFDGTISVERAIKERRTCRAFRSDPLSMPRLSQLLWAAEGQTDEQRGFRAAPSGGALYPLDLYAVVGERGVEGLPPGVYRYHSNGHFIGLVEKGDRRKELASAAHGQMWIAQAPVCFVITAEYARITGRYGERGQRYAQIEVGHVGENIMLQAGALGMGAGIVGAFSDASVAAAIKAPKGYEPLIIIPVGYKK